MLTQILPLYLSYKLVEDLPFGLNWPIKLDLQGESNYKKAYLQHSVALLLKFIGPPLWLLTGILSWQTC